MATFPRRLAPAVALLALACGGPASAQVRKCVMPDGKPLYTDQKCEALGATAFPSPPASARAAAAGNVNTGLYRAGCSRTLQDLAFEIRTAIESQDPNRLSGVYDWAGMSDAAANAVMDRLDAITHRPLLDLSPISDSTAEETTVVPPGGSDDVPRTTARRPPVGLRLEQTQGNGITPSRTTLGLRRKYGCWWISL
ncbi:hypothetical protein LVB87_01035 [Lysobacter sp. KIS68-7]|uniref:hypothetical protein n=1 Tax=Lysobacter sp. KIS68-7 TaxID=2904252 RepID=UPI001E4B92B7|nr:hypothetical protein [Lysobacter sp. KIS68-7]UHQ19786.1 hypothetical protein LVB87_01035 [Lysobacter sp. KIS68-7]